MSRTDDKSVGELWITDSCEQYLCTPDSSLYSVPIMCEQYLYTPGVAYTQCL